MLIRTFHYFSQARNGKKRCRGGLPRPKAVPSITEQTDLNRLRRQLSFDRLPARLFREESSPWVLKGGYPLELRFKDARSTVDIDLTVQRVTATVVEPPRIVVFLDEIEKAFAGTGTDLSGVKTEMAGTLLTWMQDHEAEGTIFLGPVRQESLVGASGERLRSALQVVDAVSQGRSLRIATCNSIASLPPELRRRFTMGTFFFDLPDAGDREAIWKLYLAKYGVAGERPQDDGWTGPRSRNAAGEQPACESRCGKHAVFQVLLRLARDLDWQRSGKSQTARTQNRKRSRALTVSRYSSRNWRSIGIFYSSRNRAG